MPSVIFVDVPAHQGLEPAGTVAGWILNDTGRPPVFLINGKPTEWEMVDRPDVAMAHPGIVSHGFALRYGPFEGPSSVEIRVGKTHRTLRYDRSSGDLEFPPETRHRDHRFAAPIDLERDRLRLRRIVVVGSCQIELLPAYITSLKDAPEIEYYTVNHAAALPPRLARQPENYDFQIIQIPIGAVVPAAQWFALDGSLRSAEAMLEGSVQRLELIASNLLRFTRELAVPAFVLNFLTPQQNAMGRFLPRYDLRNPVYFFERLNQALTCIVEGVPGAYILDADGLSSQFGRRYFQDDAIDNLTHSGVLADYGAELDAQRLHPVAPVSETLVARPYVLHRAIWSEAVAMNRTLRSADSVKLVVVDLDDTLWRGVLAEEDEVSADRVEGWPLGVIEALLYLRRRGVLLALLSKNEEARATAIFEKAYGRYVPLSAFATRKINWLPKPENMQAILRETNLLPRNVVFIDDNPVERAAMQAAFPDIRVLGENQYLIRRILLYAPETQVVTITEESSRRSEMIQAQIVREESRAKLSREDFIKSLGVRIERLTIMGLEHPQFPRAFELLNKTNQFNTTGRRWTAREIEALFERGGRVEAFKVRDNYTDYGLVGMAIVVKARIEQFVMSCRVIGLDVEQTVLHAIIAETGPVEAQLIPTDANMPVRSLWADLGLIEDESGLWRSVADL